MLSCKSNTLAKWFVPFAACFIAACCDRTPQLHQAVLSGKEVAVRQRLAAGEDPNARDEKGDTALHVAARTGHASEIVRLLIYAGADVNATNKQGWAPLHQALEPQVAQILIARGASVKAVDINGRTPLHSAARGWLRVVSGRGGPDTQPTGVASATTRLQERLDVLGQQVTAVLLAAGADVDSRDRLGRTPLHEAAEEGRLEQVRILLDHGANALAEDNLRLTPLDIATMQRQEGVAALLGEHPGARGANKDVTSDGAQHGAGMQSAPYAAGAANDSSISTNPLRSAKATEEAPRLGAADLPVLIKHLQDQDMLVRQEAAFSLAQMGPTAAPAVVPLIRALGDQVPGVRSNAALALGQIGRAARGAVPSLVEAAGSDLRPLRKCAVRALGQIGPDARAAVPVILAALRDGDPYTRMLAAQALGRIQIARNDVTSALERAMRDDDMAVRLSSASSLVRLNPPARKALAELVGVLKSQDKSAQEAAANAIAEAGPAAGDAAPALIEAFKTLGQAGRMEVLAEAFRGLGPAGIQALIGALKSGDQETRTQAAWVLGWIGPSAGPAVPALTEAARDQHPPVRMAVEEALLRIRQAKQREKETSNEPTPAR